MIPELLLSLTPAILGVNIYTHHTHQACTNINPGVYVQTTGGYSAGMYRNSECKVTVHAGKTIWESGLFQVDVGLMHGYSKSPIIPYILPSVKISNFRFTLIPQKRAAIHVAYEQDF